MFDGYIHQNGGSLLLIDLVDALSWGQVHKICGGAPPGPLAARPSSPLAAEPPNGPRAEHAASSPRVGVRQCRLSPRAQASCNLRKERLACGSQTRSTQVKRSSTHPASDSASRIMFWRRRLRVRAAGEACVAAPSTSTATLTSGHA